MSAAVADFVVRRVAIGTLLCGLCVQAAGELWSSGSGERHSESAYNFARSCLAWRGFRSGILREDRKELAGN